MSEVLLSFRGRQIHCADVTFLRELIARNSGLSRRKLSVKVCEAWQWLQPNGQPRDMVCRGLMLALHRAGHIELPPKRRSPINNVIAHRRVAAVAPCDTTPLEGSLASLGPLEIRLVRRAEGEALFAHLLSRYHYLGYSRPVGEHLKYLVLAGARPVACMGWSSAPRQLKLRDQFVGASKEAYRHHLHLIAYNSRYLILPWVKVPHLASHLLGRILRRISSDWQALYQHPIHLLESFVDIQRFRGTCYRAANWTCVGRSAGRGTKSKTKRPVCSVKELWVYPLDRHFRERLIQTP
ncbi:MAG TPA: Druantia anti-phage system protein DruA [Acidobacteriaceae bacterium]|nr:Druantia anti-phage system protein DruA [Acidobacteriaceae bacterium]